MTKTNRLHALVMTSMLTLAVAMPVAAAALNGCFVKKAAPVWVETKTAKKAVPATVVALSMVEVSEVRVVAAKRVRTVSPAKKTGKVTWTLHALEGEGSPSARFVAVGIRSTDDLPRGNPEQLVRVRGMLTAD
jgi:hypothetical protein